MKINDCFMYYDEDLLLDIRLNVLNKFVKKFVICEATYNHNGSPKKINFELVSLRLVPVYDCWSIDQVVSPATCASRTIALNCMYQSKAYILLINL